MGNKKEDPKQIELIHRLRFQEIRERRHWLLLRNKKFKEDLKNLQDSSGIKLIFSDVSEVFRGYSNLEPPPVYAAEIEKIRQKYQIGESWRDGEVLYRIGEKPLGLEIVGIDEQPEHARIVIFPGETTIEDIKEAWKYFEFFLEKFFTGRQNDPSYSLKNRNFWRDAGWYSLRKEKECTIEEVLDFMKKYDPLILDRLFIENMINLDKKGERQDFLDEIDPGRKILKSKLRSYKKTSQLLFAAGILKKGIAQVDLANVKNFDPVDSDEEYFQVIPGQKYYIRFDSWQRFPNFEKLFQEEKESGTEIKKKQEYRKQFYLKMKENIYFTNTSEGSGFKHVVEEAVKRMQLKIDQIA